ncbi:type III secretion protein [Paludibacterium purpuratum]|uniref:Uncharacterized protein n=1 Tax=Paludibacterium purpuratum TaxID=1144873 RepID=A0A4V3DUR4_9NEIS|nr:type III secretion protein [Paludibacterium purpuratum]TDR76597.1 hypothetical protein DFP86_11022 [Paludibacterium purpuratum]
MDLQWQRQVELWQRLLDRDAACQTICRVGGDRLQLEQQDGRALLTVSRTLADSFLATALQRLLVFLSPEASNGLPLRAWIGQGRLWLIVTMPRETPAEDWYAMSQRLTELLDRASRDGHGLGQ